MKHSLSLTGPVVRGYNWLNLPSTRQPGGHIAEVERRVCGMPEFRAQQENHFVFEGPARRLSGTIWDADLDEAEKQSDVITNWVLVASPEPEGKCFYAAWLEAHTGIRRLDWPTDRPPTAVEQLRPTILEMNVFMGRLHNRLKAPLRSVAELDRRTWEPLFRRASRS